MRGEERADDEALRGVVQRVDVDHRDRLVELDRLDAAGDQVAEPRRLSVEAAQEGAAAVPGVAPAVQPVRLLVLGARAAR